MRAISPAPAPLRRLSFDSPPFERRAASAASSSSIHRTFAAIRPRRARRYSQSGRASQGVAVERFTSSSDSPSVVVSKMAFIPSLRGAAAPKQSLASEGIASEHTSLLAMTLTTNRAPAGRATPGSRSNTTFKGPLPPPSHTSAATSPASVIRSHTRAKLASTRPVTPGRRMLAARRLSERAGISTPANQRLTHHAPRTTHHASRTTHHASRITSSSTPTQSRPPSPMRPGPRRWRPWRASAGSYRNRFPARCC